MKVYIVNAVYEIMSTGRTYKELHDFLVDRGHECKIFYGAKKTQAKDAYYMGSKFSHKLHALFSRITGKSGFYSNHATKKLLQYMKEERPDIVHLGNLHGNYINIPMLLAYLVQNRIPTVVTLHDCYFFTGGCTHYTLNNCYKWQEKCGNCKYYRKLGSWFFDRTKQILQYKREAFNKLSSLGVIGVSDWTTAEAKKAPIFEQAKYIKRIYNWVDLNTFTIIDSDIRQKHNIGTRNIVLGVASTWGQSKGLFDFLRLAEILGEAYRIVLVGKMDKKLILPDNVISVPPTNNAKALAEYYSGSDVFVQLSKEETFGKVVAEALACGTPAVVFDSTASPELVKNGCGFALPITADMEEFAKYIRVICENGNYKAVCRSQAERFFNKNTNCTEIENLYFDLINANQK